MQIKLTHTWSGHGVAGDIVEIDDERGELWIAEGTAVRVPPPVVEPSATEATDDTASDDDKPRRRKR